MCRVIGARIDEPGAIIEIKNDDTATRSRYACHFCNRLRWIFQIKENPLSPAHIERLIFEGEAVGVADVEFQR